MLKRIFTSIVTALVLTTSVFAAAPAPSKDQAKFEIRFLEEMIDHHYGAVKMAELCAGRATHAELLQMCESIETMQMAEIEMMQEWLQSWYGVTHEPHLMGKARRQIEKLSQMTGAQFEIAFMTMMIEHHSMAVMMSIDCLQRAYHPEMLNMCAEMMAAQGDEIVQLRLWLCQWYSICDLKDAKRVK